MRSITFNIADFLGGKISFGQGLTNVAIDTANSFIYFANDQIRFFLSSLPPLPPLPGGSVGPNVTYLAPTTSADKIGPRVVTAKDEVVAPTGNELPSAVVQTPEPTQPKAPRVSGLAKFIQKITQRGAADGTTSVNVQTLGDEQIVGENGAGDQTRPRPHGPVGTVNSAVRNLVASVPHPLRDRAAAPKDEKGNAGDPK